MRESGVASMSTILAAMVLLRHSDLRLGPDPFPPSPSTGDVITSMHLLESDLAIRVWRSLNSLGAQRAAGESPVPQG